MKVGILTRFCFFPVSARFVSTGPIVSKRFCLVLGVVEFVSAGSKLNDLVCGDVSKRFCLILVVVEFVSGGGNLNDFEGWRRGIKLFMSCDVRGGMPWLEGSVFTFFDVLVPCRPWRLKFP